MGFYPRVIVAHCPTGDALRIPTLDASAAALGSRTAANAPAMPFAEALGRSKTPRLGFWWFGRWRPARRPQNPVLIETKGAKRLKSMSVTACTSLP